jgi:hypothetical protein
MGRLTALVLAIVMALQTASCGFLIYPERKGQKSGSIDPGIAILDAAGLLVFVVPGLIAFGVDFVTGCIYLPGGKRAANDPQPLRTVYFDPASLDASAIEAAVGKATGQAIDLSNPAVRAVPVHDVEALEAQVAAAM